MNKLIFAQSKHMADALALKVPEFKDADVRIGYTDDIRSAIKDKVVLTNRIPDNMVSLPKQIVLCSAPFRETTAEKMDVDELAWNLRPFVAFKADQLDSADAKKSWE